MQKIVELNLDEIVAVSGGHKTVTASVSASVAQPSLSVSAVSPATLVKPALAMSTQSTMTAFRRY